MTSSEERYFLSELVKFVNKDVLPELYSADRYMDNCQIRPVQCEMKLRVNRMEYVRRGPDKELERINDILRDTHLIIDPRTRSAGLGSDNWHDILNSCSVTLHAPRGTPASLNWERTTESGRIKSDEQYPTDRDYIDRDVLPKRAMRMMIEHHSQNAIPNVGQQSDVEFADPSRLPLFYDNEPERSIVSQLEPQLETSR